MKITIYIFFLLLVLSGCKKEEELLTGSISGKIFILDQNYEPVPDQSGAEVRLLHDSVFLDSKLTDSRGQYFFGNIPYGKYKIIIKKDRFVQYRYPQAVYHVGGYSPTMVDGYLYEVPIYKLRIDSLGFDIVAYALIMHLKFNGDTILPYIQWGVYNLRVFMSNSPDVSSENYIAAGKAYLSDYSLVTYISKVAVYGKMYLYDIENTENLGAGTVYMRVYPLAIGQGYGIHDYFPEALGPPSNVIGFVWNEVVPGQ